MTDEGGARQRALVATPEELAAAREARGMSQLDISQRIKLQVKQVNALEEGQWDALPGKSFVRGALRSYGKLLDVDVGPLLESIGGFAEPAQVQGMQPLDTPISRSSGLGFNGGGRGSPILWVIAGLIGVVALVLYFGSAQDSSRIRSWLPSGKTPTESGTEPASPAAPPDGNPAPAGTGGSSSTGTQGTAGEAKPGATGALSSELPRATPGGMSFATAPPSATPSSTTPSSTTPSSTTPSSTTPSSATPSTSTSAAPSPSAAGTSVGSLASSAVAGSASSSTSSFSPTSTVPSGSPASSASPLPAAASAAQASLGTTASGSADAAAGTTPPIAALAAGTAASPATGAADGAAPFDAAATAAAAKGIMQVKAIGDTWVEVRQADGSSLHNGMVKAGATIELKGNPPYRLVLGNASQVELSYEGRVQDLTPHIRGNNIARLQLR